MITLYCEPFLMIAVTPRAPLDLSETAQLGMDECLNPFSVREQLCVRDDFGLDETPSQLLRSVLRMKSRESDFELRLGSRIVRTENIDVTQAVVYNVGLIERRKYLVEEVIAMCN